MSYELLEETAAYPFEEMANELLGIIGLYFDFTMLSFVSIFYVAFNTVRRKVCHSKNSVDLDNETE